MILRLYLAAIFIFLLLFSKAQNCLLPPSVEYSQYDVLKKVYFVYPDPVLKKIKENWGVYFKENIASVLDPEQNIFEIKLDSYGSIYPDSRILNAISSEDFHGELKNYPNLESHSFYWRFKEDKGQKIAELVKKPDIDPIYKELLSLSKSADEKEQKLFFEKWDKYHNAQLSEQLNSRIKKDEIKRVIFFIHGYNVPYSLAALQAITLYKLAKDVLGEEIKNTLLIPVYWPSNHAKVCKLSQSDFSTENIKQFKTNGRMFLGYSNRCYYSAITLRKLINSLNSSLKIDIIAHSLGATIAASALINTHSKLHYNRFSKLARRAHDSTWIVNTKKHFRNKDEINFDLLKSFYATPIPDRKITVFLSAAAIPGYNTFIDAKPKVLQNTSFYITINPNDEMVTKKEIQNVAKNMVYLKIAYINSARLGGTTLGCNYKNDACLTKSKWGTKNPLYVKTISYETDHDIFTYVQQQDYKNYFRDFLLNLKPNEKPCPCETK